MFNKILIANRGEIACRIIKTARKLGVKTVAVYSDVDRDALHVAMADEAVHIGAPAPRESYLCGDKVIAAAIKTGAQAIHPGYGFLSENSEFCNQCKDSGLIFIGPPIEAIKAMGSKSAAKTIMENANVPLVPGYHGDDQNPEILRKTSNEMGYPVLLKAAAGGGGKGMRQVWSAEEFDQALAAAKRESMNAFGDDKMLVEKYLTQPRHVEFQVFCDNHGNAVYLFERDCSVQRRHQKVIEEAPAPGMTDELRAKMGDAAVRAAQAINYQGAGTVEFLLDVDGSFYFMEMNTRLQVEHPITEFITGQDLVEWQLRVAAGENLPMAQDELQINGHAFEARIYAEDPDNNFLPVTGTLNYLRPPAESDHVRVDTGVLQGDEVSVFYDPMIAKLVVWDENRDRALNRLCGALAQYRISGMTTNTEFLYNLASSQAFRDAELDTGFIEKHRHAIFQTEERDSAQYLPLAALYLVLKQQRLASQRAIGSNDPHSPWNQPSAWRLNEAHRHTLAIELNGQTWEVIVEVRSGPRFLITVDEQRLLASGELNGDELYADIDGFRQRASASEHDGLYTLFTNDRAVHFSLLQPDIGDAATDAASGMAAPMNGTIVTLLVEVGADVEAGTPLLVMEAMKMEHTIRAPAAGRVTEFYCHPGDLVDGGSELVAFEVLQQRNS